MACLTLGQDVPVPDPVFSIPSAGGLRIEIPDVSGLTEADIHFSINKPVPGVAAADYNIIIRFFIIIGFYILMYSLNPT